MSQSTTPASVEEVAFKLHSAALHLMRRIRREDERLALSAPRLSALSTVAFGQPHSIGEMARMEQVTPPTMTRLVGALERDGLITRTLDRQDKRVVWVRATAKGRKLVERGRSLRVAFLAEHFRAFSREDVAALDRASDLMHGVYFSTR